MIIDGINLIEGSLAKNVMITSMTESQRLALNSVNAGELVFQTDNEKGVYYYNGSAWVPFAMFDTNGKLPLSRLPSTILGDMKFKGSFDASNPSSLPTPSNAADATNNVGWFYICNVAGTINSIAYDIKDWAISDGQNFIKISNVDTVRKVNNISPVDGNISLTFGGDISVNLDNNEAKVVKIQNIPLSSTAPTAGQVLEYDSVTSTAKWSNKSLPNITGDVTVSTLNVSTVAKVNGVAVTGTPTSGQTLVATSANAASWAAPVSTKDKTAITGLLKGDGTNVTAAVAGTDYVGYTTPVGAEKRIADSQGDLRRLFSRDSGNATITLVNTDAGKNITTSYSTATSTSAPLVTISKPATPIFKAGDIFSIFNNSGLDHFIKIDSTITTCYVSGTDTNKSNTSDLKLSKRGIMSVHFVTDTLVVLSGNVA